jgi:hypothetical protein
MASLFDKDHSAQPELATYGIERIESEISHLRNPESTRSKKIEKYVLAWWMVSLAVIALLSLYFLDPVLHSYQKGSAIKTYLYLHTSGSDAKQKALADCGILSKDEIDLLDNHQGGSLDYFSSPQAAEQSADAIVAYCQSVKYLQNGQYDHLDPLNKFRYNLFGRWGIPMPTEWAALNPTVK